MFKIVAAPSPYGTNRKRLFVPAKVFGSGFAYDARPEELSKRPRGDIATLLKAIAKMSPEGRNIFFEALLKSNTESAEDEPPSFKGRPRPDGAMDGLPDFDRLAERRRTGAETSFASMYPGAMDIKVYR